MVSDPLQSGDPVAATDEIPAPERVPAHMPTVDDPPDDRSTGVPDPTELGDDKPGDNIPIEVPI